MWSLCPWRELAGVDIPAWIIDFAGRSADFATIEPRKDAAIFGTASIAAVSSRLSNSPRLSSCSVYTKDASARFFSNLEHCLEANSRVLVSLSIPALPGSMVSDQYILLKEAIRQKREPSLLILTLAPRDFIDNDVGLRLDETPLRTVFSFLSSNRHFFPPTMSAEGWRLCFESHRSFFSLMQKRIRRVMAL